MPEKYVVRRKTPAMEYPVESFATKADARRYLRHARENYAAAYRTERRRKPEYRTGSAERPRWLSRDKIAVYAGHDYVTYTIY